MSEMPFAGYRDFEDCVRRNSNKEDPSAYCGAIQHAVEEGEKLYAAQLEKGPTQAKIIKTERPALQKIDGDGAGNLYLHAYVSSTRRDRDLDRFSKNVLDRWAGVLNNKKINMGFDHGQSWRATGGVWVKGEVRQNPYGDDINSAKHYLFAEARLEDPNINPDIKLLQHKAEIGEQISVSIAANPEGEKWFDEEIDKDGVSVRVIKSAELFKIDVVGEPANPDARMIGIFPKHVYHEGSDKCVDRCPACFIEKDFAECCRKSMAPAVEAPDTDKQRSAALAAKECVERYGTIKDGTVRFELGSEQDQLLHARDLTHSHVCVHTDGSKSIERFGTRKKSLPIEDDWTEEFSSLVNEDTTKPRMTELSKEEQDKLNKDKHCAEGEHYCPDEDKCVPDEEMKSKLSPEIEKFIEVLKAVASQPEDQALTAVVQRALAQLSKPEVPQGEQPALNTPVENKTQPEGTGSPQPEVAPQPAAAPEPAKPAPAPEAPAKVSEEAKVRKVKVKSGFAGILASKERVAELERAREKVKPKQENPGEMLPYIIDTSKITEPLQRKAAEEYNNRVREIHASLVRQQYTADDLVKMSEAGQLIKDLDPHNNFDKTVKIIAGSGSVRKTIRGSLLLTKTA